MSKITFTYQGPFWFLEIYIGDQLHHTSIGPFVHLMQEAAKIVDTDEFAQEP